MMVVIVIRKTFNYTNVDLLKCLAYMKGIVINTIHMLLFSIQQRNMSLIVGIVHHLFIRPVWRRLIAACFIY